MTNKTQEQFMTSIIFIVALFLALCSCSQKLKQKKEYEESSKPNIPDFKEAHLQR